MKEYYRQFGLLLGPVGDGRWFISRRQLIGFGFVFGQPHSGAVVRVVRADKGVRVEVVANPDKLIWDYVILEEDCP